jgi:hypothetical protein
VRLVSRVLCCDMLTAGVWLCADVLALLRQFVRCAMALLAAPPLQLELGPPHLLARLRSRYAPACCAAGCGCGAEAYRYGDIRASCVGVLLATWAAAPSELHARLAAPLLGPCLDLMLVRAPAHAAPTSLS